MTDAVRAIIENAERLLSDANILAAAHSYRSAIALSILSFEESGKACLVRWQKEGWLDDKSSLLRHHAEKQRIFLAYRAVLAIAKFGVLVKTDDARPPLKMTSDIQEKLSEELERQTGVDRLTMDGGLHDYLKENGLYVDIDDRFEVVEPYTTYTSDVFQRSAAKAAEAIEMASAPFEFQRMMALFYTAGIFRKPTPKQTKELQKRMFAMLDVLYAAGAKRPEG